jgi:adenosine deaminase
MSLSTVMEAVVEGLQMAEYRLSITVRIIVCGMRQMSAEVSKDLGKKMSTKKNQIRQKRNLNEIR